jgi:arginine/lysine/ornithine decarboxylase
MFDKVIEAAEWARKEINEKIPNMRCLTKNDIKDRNFDLDLTKLTINVTKTGLSGYEVDSILAKEYNIQVDCSDTFNLIAIMGIGSDMYDVQKLVSALKDISKKYKGTQKNWILKIPSLATEMVMTPREVFLSHDIKKIPLAKSVGHVSAQVLTPYPPGIPVVIPGERISKEICDYLIEMVSKGVRISGQEGDKLKMVKVFAN